MYQPHPRLTVLLRLSRAYLNQPLGLRQRPPIWNPVSFHRHWRLERLEHCLRLSWEKAQRP